jgi:uncharacterized membrane protein YcaP (DUF421 family)
MELFEWLKHILGEGLEPKDMAVLQVCLRAVVVFLVSLAIIRLGHKRFMSRMTAFDAVLGFILASMLARAINGSGPLLPTLAAGVVLVLLHRLLSALAFHSPKFGAWIKGQPAVLLEAGHTKPDALRAHKISENDLLEEARTNGKVTNLSEIRFAVLERSGEISIIPAKNGG